MLKYGEPLEAVLRHREALGAERQDLEKIEGVVVAAGVIAGQCQLVARLAIGAGQLDGVLEERRPAGRGRGERIGRCRGRFGTCRGRWRPGVGRRCGGRIGRLLGGLQIDKARARVPAAGIELSDLALSVRGEGGSPLRIDGTLSSGKGSLQLDGTFDLASNAVDLRVVGEEFEAVRLPEARVDDSVAVLQGLDGRKMSKSYNNTIPLFAPEKRLRKLIMKIKTNSLEPGEAKDPSDSTLFDIYKAFATPEETAGIEKAYAEGIAWGEMKQRLFEYINDHIKPARDEYDRLIADPAMVEAELRRGAERARELSAPYLDQIRAAIGIRRLG